MIQYNPIKINPSRPMSVDVANSLATTLREGNALARESKNQLNAVTMALPTAPTEEEYKINKLAELNEQIEGAAMFGNMFFAQDEISAAAEQITKDPIINDSIKSYQNYTTWKQSIQDRTDISQLTKNRVIATNPYISTADRTNTETGQITQWEFNGISPVKDISINELFDAALQRINPEYIYSENFAFYDDKGNVYNEYKPGITVLMTNKQTHENIKLTTEKIEEAIKAAISADQQYRDAINQERANIKWAKDQDDYDGQFDRFLENGEVVDYDKYINRLVHPLANASSYQKTKDIDEWTPTTININSRNDKGNGNDNGIHNNASGIGINFKGYNEIYTNTLTTEVAAAKDVLDHDISETLSNLGVDMSDFTVDANSPDDIINHINANDNLNPQTKQRAIAYVNTAVNYYQAQNAQYTQMLDRASYKGKINKIALDAIMSNKKIDFDALHDMASDKTDLVDYFALKDIYDNCYSDFFGYTTYIGVEPNTIHYDNSGVYFEDNDSYNKFISLYGNEQYLLDQGYKIKHKDGKHIIYISDTKDNLMFQFASKIKDFMSSYGDNKIKKYLESSGIRKTLSGKEKPFSNELYFKDMPQSSIAIANKIQKIKDNTIKDFGDQEIIVTSKISPTPDPILDDRYGAMRFGTEKYTEFKGRLEQISKSLEQGLRQAPTLNMFDVQIGDDETGEYQDVKRKELDKIQSLIRNPNSKIYIAYTSSMNGVTPYCTVMSEDGSEQYNFTLNGWLEDDVLKNLNEDIRYTYIANNYAYAGYDMQIGLNPNNQAISLRAKDNGDDTFSFYLVDNNGKEIDGIKLDSYDAATLKRCYDALRPYIDKQYTKEGLTQEDYNNIEYLINVFNHTLISNYAKNIYNLDIKTEKQIEDFLEKINATEENWLNVGGVSPVNAFLGAIGLTYSAQ